MGLVEGAIKEKERDSTQKGKGIVKCKKGLGELGNNCSLEVSPDCQATNQKESSPLTARLNKLSYNFILI